MSQENRISEILDEQARRHRTLTDEDVQAITDSLQKKIMADFYQDLGKGFFGLIKKSFFILITLVAAYGAMKGFVIKEFK